MRPGIDHASIAEVAQSLDRFGERYLRRVLTAAERSAVFTAAGPSAGNTAERPAGNAAAERPVATVEPGTERVRRLAEHFAAKEATFKALRVRSCDPVPWTDIEVDRRVEPPTVVLHGAARRRAEELGVRRVHLALSLTATGVLACALAEDSTEQPPGVGGE